MVWLNTAIPTQIGGGVGVGAAVVGIPAAGQAIVTAVLPAHIPAIDRTSATVGYSNGGSEPVIPLVGDYILTASIHLG